MSQIENSKRASLQAVPFRDLEIRILNLFRISIFELRISKGKLDRFVNLVVTKNSWPRASYRRGTEPPMHADSRRCNPRTSACIGGFRRFQTLSYACSILQIRLGRYE